MTVQSDNASVPLPTAPTAAAEPPPAPKPAKLPREEDPRNPNKRLAALFDEGTLQLIRDDDDSGMLAGVGCLSELLCR